MRFSGILSVATVFGMALSAAACGDDKAGAIVSDDISWYVGCGTSGATCTLFNSHTQAAVDQNFGVKCSRSGNFVNITLTDPGFQGDVMKLPRPASTVVISNAAVGGGRCDVSVSEGSQYEFAPEKLIGTCDGACTFTGQSNSMGWDFIGLLQCNGLKKQNAMGAMANTLYTLGSAAEPGQPIKIAVDNCN